ncbi:MAG TPA: NTP transferase domain-containing protein [Polyangiaceae bacterium]|nr:NTP transferase domain-containing protein [Polyangiaceae bacterium]
MRPVIIGAGRGMRLGHETNSVPKTMVPVMGRPMLEWVLEALGQAGFQKRDVIFICGYAEDVVRSRYPEFTFVKNADWQNNNILLSLLCAREHLGQGFVSTYADIVYEGAVVQKLVDAREDIVLGCDTRWRRRYTTRQQHPETDAEKLRADGRRVVELSRRIESEQAQGEFIGVMKLTAAGAGTFLDAFDRARSKFAGQTYREGRSFEKAYLIDLLADMLEQGSVMHREDTAGGYMEIDTLEDLGHAERWWKERA